MGSKYELFYGEVHPVIKDTETYIRTLHQEQLDSIEEALRKGIRDNERKEILLWLPFGAIRGGTPVSPTDLMYLAWYVRDFLDKTKK